jgi:hypothetical protein
LQDSGDKLLFCFLGQVIRLFSNNLFHGDVLDRFGYFNRIRCVPNVQVVPYENVHITFSFLVGRVISSNSLKIGKLIFCYYF